MIKNPNTKAARRFASSGPARSWRSPARPSRTGSASCGRSSTPSTRACSAASRRFREQFGTPIERHGDADAAARLRRLTQPFVLRRTKADRRLLPDLPDKIEQIAYAKLTREQAVLYQQVVDQLLADAERGRGHAAAWPRARRADPAEADLQPPRPRARATARGSPVDPASCTRFDELVTELLDVDERALVFTQFREMGELLAAARRASSSTSTPRSSTVASSAPGATGWSTRSRHGTAPPLLLVSLKAGGTGLNLTAASQVIHYDRWWNPAVEDQATDRAWRIGQHRTVNVHKLVCEGTVEERIGARDRRQARARRLRGRRRRGVAVRAVDRRPARPRRARIGTTGEPATQPFGADHPGRLPATMIKVLAAEMSDPRALRRGKQYAERRLGDRHRDRARRRHGASAGLAARALHRARSRSPARRRRCPSQGDHGLAARAPTTTARTVRLQTRRGGDVHVRDEVMPRCRFVGEVAPERQFEAAAAAVEGDADADVANAQPAVPRYPSIPVIAEIAAAAESCAPTVTRLPMVPELRRSNRPTSPTVSSPMSWPTRSAHLRVRWD